MNVKTDGLVVATFSPMKEDGALNLGIVPAYAETLAGDGVAGLFVNGSTGEGVSMTNRERMASAEAWKAASGDMKFIVHVGHHALIVTMPPQRISRGEDRATLDPNDDSHATSSWLVSRCWTSSPSVTSTSVIDHDTSPMIDRHDDATGPIDANHLAPSGSR